MLHAKHVALVKAGAFYLAHAWTVLPPDQDLIRPGLAVLLNFAALGMACVSYSFFKRYFFGSVWLLGCPVACLLLVLLGVFFSGFSAFRASLVFLLCFFVSLFFFAFFFFGFSVLFAVLLSVFVPCLLDCLFAFSLLCLSCHVLFSFFVSLLLTFFSCYSAFPLF